MNWKHALFMAICVGSGVTLAQYSFSGVSSINLIVNYSVSVPGAFTLFLINCIGKKMIIKPVPYNEVRHIRRYALKSQACGLSACAQGVKWPN